MKNKLKISLKNLLNFTGWQKNFIYLKKIYEVVKTEKNSFSEYLENKIMKIITIKTPFKVKIILSCREVHKVHPYRVPSLKKKIKDYLIKYLTIEDIEKKELEIDYCVYCNIFLSPDSFKEEEIKVIFEKYKKKIYEKEQKLTSIESSALHYFLYVILLQEYCLFGIESENFKKYSLILDNIL